MNCPVCNTELVKYGFTSTGKQRYRCNNCGFVKVLKNPAVDPEIERLESWIRRLERRIEELETGPEVNPDNISTDYTSHRKKL